MASHIVTVRIIDRTTHADGSVSEVVERDGKVYEEQTKPVKYGTVSRRTILYPSYDEYSVARMSGTLKWMTQLPMGITG